MKILALPNAFKGALSAPEAARIITHALGARHCVRTFPVSDGGDGFIAFFQALDKKAVLLKMRAKNAFGQTKNTSFLMLADGKTAVVETARVCGIGNTPKEKLDPLGATSYGVGQVILAASRKGARHIFIGLGGVACSDGGAGMLAALGAEITDKNGNILPPGAEPLLRVKSVNLQKIYEKNPALKKVTFVGFSDVKNPVLGPKSSAKVFGPQKGATPEQVKLLDRALGTWVRTLARATGKSVSRVSGTAAAGAIGAGLAGGLNGALVQGAQTLFEKARLEKEVKAADLIITTEGKLDRQTFYGKAPLAVLQLARKYRKKIFFICGQLDMRGLKKQPLFPQQIAVLTDFATDENDAKKHAAKLLARVCKTI
jgi:glycerate kinase